MSLAPARNEVIAWPAESELTMPESPIHFWAVFYLIEALKQHLQRRDDMLVGSDQMVYLRPQDPKACFAADVFVWPGKRTAPRVWKLWEEGGRFADVVIEVSSPSTWKVDITTKKDQYLATGVKELYVFDPLPGRAARASGRPSFQAFFREGDTFVGQPLGPAGYWSPILDVWLQRDGETLRLVHPDGHRYPIGQERLEAEAAAAAASAAVEAEQRQLAEAATAELLRVRGEAARERAAAAQALALAEANTRAEERRRIEEEARAERLKRAEARARRKAAVEVAARKKTEERLADATTEIAVAAAEISRLRALLAKLES